VLINENEDGIMATQLSLHKVGRNTQSSTPKYTKFNTKVKKRTKWTI